MPKAAFIYILFNVIFYFMAALGLFVKIAKGEKYELTIGQMGWSAFIYMIIWACGWAILAVYH